jgi:OOP family OmpA-OmpF porin
MKEYPNTKAIIEGHTDSVGSDAYNLRLSNDRSNSVRQYLIKEFGVDASRLTSKGYGESRPIATNDTDEGRQKNRRVWAVLEEIGIK